MTLELTLLLSIFGLAIMSTVGNPETGIKGQFSKSAPYLAGRMERNMAVGRCFNIPVGGTDQICDEGFLFSGAILAEKDN